MRRVVRRAGRSRRGRVVLRQRPRTRCAVGRGPEDALPAAIDGIPSIAAAAESLGPHRWVRPHFRDARRPVGSRPDYATSGFAARRGIAGFCRPYAPGWRGLRLSILACRADPVVLGSFQPFDDVIHGQHSRQRLGHTVFGMPNMGTAAFGLGGDSRLGHAAFIFCPLVCVCCRPPASLQPDTPWRSLGFKGRR